MVFFTVSFRPFGVAGVLFVCLVHAHSYSIIVFILLSIILLRLNPCLSWAKNFFSECNSTKLNFEQNGLYQSASEFRYKRIPILQISREYNSNGTWQWPTIMLQNYSLLEIDCSVSQWKEWKPSGIYALVIRSHGTILIVIIHIGNEKKTL